jgi:hypothetical protein
VVVTHGWVISRSRTRITVVAIVAIIAFVRWRRRHV